MIGNYGVPDELDPDEHGISKYFESTKVPAHPPAPRVCPAQPRRRCTLRRWWWLI